MVEKVRALHPTHAGCRRTHFHSKLQFRHLFSFFGHSASWFTRTEREIPKVSVFSSKLEPMKPDLLIIFCKI